MKLLNPLRFFANGLEALDYLQTTSEQPFLILPRRRTGDINMPLMNGLELRQQINQSDFLRHKSSPFIFLTTSFTPELVRQAFDATVQGYYKKAPDYAGLRQQLARIGDYSAFDQRTAAAADFYVTTQVVVAPGA